MSCTKCFVCNEEIFNDNETRIIVRRTERSDSAVKTSVFDAAICDKCYVELLEYATALKEEREL